MTRRISEPTPERGLVANRFQTKDTRQKPQAFRWWEPDCTLGVGCSEEQAAVVLLNGVAQPTGASGLEAFAFRLNADGQIDTKGFLDVSAASSGVIAWVMPGINAGETDFIPPATDNDGFSLRVSTDGTLAGVTPASAHVDNTTGDVTITWGGVGVAPRARGKVLTTVTIGSGTLTAIMGTTTTDFDEELNDDASVFSFVDVSGQGRGIKVLQDGLYSLICRIACGSLATPFVIDFNHFLTGDLTYELYSYPVYVGQLAVDVRLAGYAAITMRIKDNVAVVPMIYHTAGVNRTHTEGGFFEVIKHAEGILSTSDLSWP